MGDDPHESSEERETFVKAQFINARNSGFVLPDTCDEASIEEIVVWGGLVANCAEHSLSEMVDRQSCMLKSVTYCPSWTKGGVLIRPKYWLGNRSGTAVFPNLRHLTIRLDPPILPQDYGWLTPALRTLRLLHVTQSILEDNQGADIEANMPSTAALQHWIDTSSLVSYSKRMLENSPELESITVALASTAGASQESLDWIRLIPPSPLSWDIQRLLLIVVHKPDGSCAMSVLTTNLVRNIMNFLGSSSWQRVIFKLQPDRIARLGLPKDFDNQAMVSLL